MPALPVDEIVPVRNVISERTPLMAEGNSAIHAPRTLVADLRVGCREIHLVPVEHADGNRTLARLLPFDVDEAGDVTHGTHPRARRTRVRGFPRAPALPRPARACNLAE